jgi:uncharacterized protein
MVNAASVADLIRLNGGELVGKTRLQKSAYFLEIKGAGFGFDFSYHHFGPYSEELSDCVDDAKALDFIDINWKRTQAGMSYAVFQCKQSTALVDEKDPYRQCVLSILKKYSAVELELAATANFLQHNGYESDPWAETRRRKASKVNDDRLTKSKQLLGELEII